MVQGTGARIRLAWPDVGADELEEVAGVLASGQLTMGPKVGELEAELERACEVEHAVAVSSGTAALHLALLALGIGPGDVVVVAPGTYSGAGNVSLIFSGKDITVTTEAGAQQTIIDCGNSSRAFVFANGDASTVEGFTIRNGNAIMGGALYSDCASPTTMSAS